MSLAAIWDRFWWSLMLTIFAGALWLKFVDPLGPNVRIGIAVASVIGAAYFAIGLSRMIRQKRREEEIERAARRDLQAELGKEEAP